jgi:hypothetical protein
MDNPDIQDTGQINVRQNQNGQLRMDNPETLATLATQDIGKLNVRENRSGNQE